MGIILFIVFGLIAGLLARAITPGTQKMGLAMTALLGVAGSFIGGFVVSLLTHHRVADLHTAGMVGSILGAVALLLIAGSMPGRHASS
jgi:uncharacterized membrane protein YeaQ/YmgE (transglycosylase-associated protein family)